MERWEYRKFEIHLQGNEYIARYDNHPEMRGWETIMDHWTEHGWELVSMVPLESQRINAFSEHYGVRRFLAVWKRRKATQEEP